jgi:hypothetical protein
MLWEARPNDPAVPQGKVLARIGGEQPGSPAAADGGGGAASASDAAMLAVLLPVMLQCWS